MDSLKDLLPNDNSNNNGSKNKLSSVQVDLIVDELVRVYGNEEYRKWYCRLVYQLGIDAINDLKGRCSDAESPPRLFAYLAKQALDAKISNERFGRG